MQEKNKSEELITPKRASEILGVTISRVTALCSSNVLTHKKIGRYNFPYYSSVIEYKQNPRRLRYATRGAKMPTYMRKNT